MSPDVNDYHALEDPGCCLLCEDAEEGCLCFECKCRKCSHYVPGAWGGGRCDLAEGSGERQKAEVTPLPEYFRQQKKIREEIDSTPYPRRPKHRSGNTSQYASLGQKIRTLNERTDELEKEVLALREALSIREMGPQGIVPLGPEDR
jgi:hypothetical protein